MFAFVESKGSEISTVLRKNKIPLDEFCTEWIRNKFLVHDISVHNY